jgi:uncharacterized protein (TIGR04255 family)
MTERPADLPDYRVPPIEEVAISIQFPPIEGFYDTHAGLYWQTVRRDYPRSETQPRLEGPIETAADPSPMALQLQLAQGQGRSWLISAADDFLIQVQNTRFIQNWRRREADYQHFEAIRDLFWENFGKFVNLLEAENLSSPLIQQVEVTYINWIPDLPMSVFLRPASAAEISVPGVSRQPEQQSWLARYLLENDKELIQRLYVQCLPAIRPQTPDLRGSQFALIFRAARVAGIPNDEVAELIDVARVTIVNAFTELTTQAAQELWGRFK